MVELRKRPAPKETATPAPAAKRANSKPRPATKKDAPATKKTKPSSKKASENAEEAPVKPAAAAAATTTTKKDSSFPLSSTSIGSTISAVSKGVLAKDIVLNTDTPTSVSKLLSDSNKGIVIFSYPKASTPGCTTQVCLFRDSYAPLTEAGLSVYGLSADSPKSNTTFVTKQKLPYPLLCDPEGLVSGPLGLKKPNPAKGTVRGVVVITKGAKDDEAEVQVYLLGGPQKTLDVVLEWVEKEKKAADAKL